MREPITSSGDHEPWSAALSQLATQLTAVMQEMGPVAIAVSGGVDSVTLAAFAYATLDPDAIVLLHAVSAAVPADATARLAALAAQRRWRLQHIDAGELADPRYVANPVDRCFFCKTNLYATMGASTDRQLLSGTNVDDLGEYRPGLAAAADHGVRHPFVEAQMRKSHVRALARSLGLGEFAELPASPCLSSRVETGIPIASSMLAFVDAVEGLVRAAIAAQIVRCRVRASGIVVELDEAALERVGASLEDGIRAVARAHGVADGPVRFAPYVNGSAFLRTRRSEPVW